MQGGKQTSKDDELPLKTNGNNNSAPEGKSLAKVFLAGAKVGKSFPARPAASQPASQPATLTRHSW